MTYTITDMEPNGGNPPEEFNSVQKTEIEAALNDLDSAKAENSSVVHITGNQTIVGEKTFSSPVVVPDAVNANHAVNRSQLDAARAGLIVKEAVRAASTANVNIANPGTAVFDGVTLSVGEDILLKDQLTGSQNGIYVFNGSGVAMTRRSDADSSAEVKTGMAVWVSEGTANADKRFALTTNAPIVLGTTSLTFVQDAAASGVTAVTASNGVSSTAGPTPNLQLDFTGLAATSGLTESDVEASYSSAAGGYRKNTIAERFALFLSAARIFRAAVSIYSTTANFFTLRRYGGAGSALCDRAQGTEGAETAVSSGQTIFSWTYRGHDGTGFIDAVLEETLVGGTVATGNVPGLWRVRVRNLLGSIVERLRVAGGGVGINTGADNHASALFQVDSTTQGVALPRMTSTQRDAISSPLTGLEITNTTTTVRKEVFNGNAWVPPTGYSDKTYLSGLNLVWTSNTGFTVTSGAAYTEGLGTVIELAADSPQTPTLTANAWYYVYLYVNVGTPSIEVSTTAPASPYRGNARSKSGDTSRRFIGSFRTNASSQIFNFIRVGNTVWYRCELGAAPHRVLSNGSNTSQTNISLSAVVPPTSRLCYMRGLNYATNTAAGAYTAVSDGTFSGPVNGGYLFYTPNQTPIHAFHPVDSSGNITYWYAAAPTGGNFFVDVQAYQEER